MAPASSSASRRSTSPRSGLAGAASPGSIRGSLQVGPQSAGADPGPACYGRGGVEPTVTDANVVLGYIPAGTVADGQISISAELDRRGGSAASPRHSA